MSIPLSERDDAVMECVNADITAGGCVLFMYYPSIPYDLFSSHTQTDSRSISFSLSFSAGLCVCMCE